MGLKITDTYKGEYKKLNQEQKLAVDTIEGPVMVVAGPGTGKTQVLALRIGNILLKTDTPPDGVLCLTFTNSAVKAMRERLRRYIGPDASKVQVSTFHSFGLDMIHKYFGALGLEREPELLDEKEAISLYDEILAGNVWKYIRPRTDASRYFRDLKSLISFLKRERLSAEQFQEEVKKEIVFLENNPENISSKGASKGELKKEIQKKIDGLYRTEEAAKFYGIYEKLKQERALFDYDDILGALVQIVQESSEARNFVKENFLYVLIDEHQDSSGVQNEFLRKVWSGEERPNIFVVGDDRQLIYGFGGAALEYFEDFKSAFGKAKLITLTENYRSTQRILDTSHHLLQSSLSEAKLRSNHGENHELRLIEAYYPRDEIIFSGLEILSEIKKGISPNEIAILVPKNRQVTTAIAVLKNMGVPVAGGESVNLFDSPEAFYFINILKIIADPSDGAAFAASFFDPLSSVAPLAAHKFIKGNKMKDFSLITVAEEKKDLFSGESEINIWIKKLKAWLEASILPLNSFIQKVGMEFLLETAKTHKDLIQRIEIVRTILHLVLKQVEKNPQIDLKNFLVFLDRLRSYGESIPLAIFAPDEGVKVLTLHGSKGLEFDYVWIAHMDEKSFGGSRPGSFAMPAKVKEKSEKKEEIVLKRELYVAITRARRFCTISYSLKSYSGGDQELSPIVVDIKDNFQMQSASETEKIILKKDPKYFVAVNPTEKEFVGLEELAKIVGREYTERKVSVSLLNNFFECPWKWYFRNLLQLPEVKSESLEFGDAVHSAIDKILKLKKMPSPAELEKITNGNQQVYAIATLWIKNRLPQISISRENERSVGIIDERFPHLSIYGKIDLIENLDPENVRVTDFKTGSVRKESEIEKIDEEGRMSTYLRQLAMYSYLLSQNPKWNKKVSGRLEFLEAKNPKEAILDRDIAVTDMEMLIKDIQDYDKLVKTGQWISRPCNYNSYGKNTSCEYCEMAKIYKTPLSQKPK